MTDQPLPFYGWEHLGASQVLEAFQKLADEAEQWPDKAIYPADLRRTIMQIRHDCGVDADAESGIG